MKVTSRLPRQLRAGFALCFALAAAPFGQAIVITLNNHYYDVTTVVALDSDPILRTTPWWYENAGSQGNSLAISAAQQVGLAFGVTHADVFGPFFSWRRSNNASYYLPNQSVMMVGGFGINQVTWAVATEVAAPPVSDSGTTAGLLALATSLLLAIRRRSFRRSPGAARPSLRL